MVSTDNLMREIEHLRDENARLRDLLRAHGIPLPVTTQDADSTAELKASSTPVVTKGSPIAEKAALFLSLFQGRRDVYARRWEGKNGRAGYSPACRNEWKPGICLKPKGKCAECAHAEYCAFDAVVVEAHLRGKAVLGVYPLLQDETCRFLAIDFDEESWRADVAMTVQAARESDIPCSVEISRSGNGAHLRIFFAEPVEATKARQMGSALLTQAMKKHVRLAFSSYDCMFPNQDTMPKGGFGNLIALPLQPAAACQRRNRDLVQRHFFQHFEKCMSDRLLRILRHAKTSSPTMTSIESAIPERRLRRSDRPFPTAAPARYAASASAR